VRALIHSAEAHEQRLMDVISLGSSLSNLKEHNFAPSLVVDVGANRGNWTLEAYRSFPTAEFVLLDADPVNQPYLKKVCQSLLRCRFFISLLGAERRESMRFFQMGTGSSVLPERTEVKRNVLTLPMTTLDEQVAPGENATVLLKLDVQGYELEVLSGARNVLSMASVVIIECSLIQYNDGAPLFIEVVSFMRDRGFVIYDLCGLVRSAEDGALFQLDVVFVREDSPLRMLFGQTHQA